MKTPIDGARLSSGFGKRRHPILGYNKMHRGIDFAAKRGTPIYAAGDGIIERANFYGAYGRYIRIGKLLHISFYWYNPSLSQSSSTAWVLRNLPFDLETGSTSAYQFIPGGYYFFENNSGYGDSSTGAGMLRWQANGTFSSNTLTLYSDNNARNANGAVEFSGTGTLVLP